MALEAVVFQQDPFNYGLGGSGSGSGPCTNHFGFQQHEKPYCTDHQQSLVKSGAFSFSAITLKERVVENYNDSASAGIFAPSEHPAMTDGRPMGRRKRRRSRSAKNKEEIENQRMTHIAVERNRRKQMNDYLSVLRSMMPTSYVQRGDQASIIGGAINFVKELEQLLQSLEARKRIGKKSHNSTTNLSSLVSDFFSFPQHSASSSTTTTNQRAMAAPPDSASTSSVADVEVTMVENHANLRILTKRHPKLLLKMVTALQSRGLNVLHLNVTSIEDMGLYSLSVKVEDNCELTTVNDIAAAVYEMVDRFQKEAAA